MDWGRPRRALMEEMLFAARIRWKRADESGGEALFAQSMRRQRSSKGPRAALDCILFTSMKLDLRLHFTFFYYVYVCYILYRKRPRAETLSGLKISCLRLSRARSRGQVNNSQ